MAQIFAADRAKANGPGTTGTPRAVASPDERLATLQARAEGSAPTRRLGGLQALSDRGPVQRFEEEEMMQAKADGPLQRMEDEEPLQGRFGAPLQRQEAQGGLPASLAAGIEHLSGADMSGVRVHRNSSAPGQLQAHAFAQGSDIHVAPGQDQHLPHEAWHVAQQQQGRVQPTTAVGDVAVNDDPGLEREADTMGARAAQVGAQLQRDS